MIIGIPEVLLDEVVIDILHRAIGSDTIEVHRLEFQHHHRAGGVLCQGLIDSNTDLLPCGHRARNEVRLNQFSGEVQPGVVCLHTVKCSSCTRALSADSITC